ncbi:1825_t:CDS:1 [Funneliformis mosseae]|uniref:1825_t:CDS:1 n=1 Tax=Funneliformis mosseae TaxID=27381 RepID=A0A9N8WM64_FUNMO|nr:1825_t:CDS:1 [Funneliformis mosseae]
MTFLSKIIKNEKVIQKDNRKIKSKKTTKSSLRRNVLKVLYETNKKSHCRKKPLAAPKIYSKDDIFTVPSHENVKARSRSQSISYNLRSILHHSNLTPDEKTCRPVKSINIKVNVFWGEKYKKELVDISISRICSYNSFKKILSKSLGYEMPCDFAILYHTKRFYKNNMMRILIDYWIENKVLWLVDNDFKFRKHMLLWRDEIEITIVRKSIIY